MELSSKLFMLLLLSVFALSIVRTSLAYEDSEFESLAAALSPSTSTSDQQITCPVPQNRCASECDRRCSATSHKKPCLFFCNKCCNKCLCVPPGTFGAKECCPCYNNWKTKEGGPKCP